MTAIMVCTRAVNAVRLILTSIGSVGLTTIHTCGISSTVLLRVSQSLTFEAPTQVRAQVNRARQVINFKLFTHLVQDNVPNICRNDCRSSVDIPVLARVRIKHAECVRIH